MNLLETRISIKQRLFGAVVALSIPALSGFRRVRRSNRLRVKFLFFFDDLLRFFASGVGELRGFPPSLATFMESIVAKNFLVIWVMYYIIQDNGLGIDRTRP